MTEGETPRVLVVDYPEDRRRRLASLFDTRRPRTGVAIVGSPAIDAATSTILVDLDRVIRPQGAANDLGAFEYF